MQEILWSFPMFFYLSKLISAVIFPYPLFLLISIVAALKLKASKFKYIYTTFLISILIISSNTGFNFLIRPLEDRHPHVPLNSVEQSDVVVVLSGMVNPITRFPDRTEFLGNADRIIAAKDLWANGKAKKILITGGTGLLNQSIKPEAILLQQWLIDQGVSAEAIYVEEKSRNTAENAIYSARIISKMGWKKIILVTSAFHMARSVMTFRKAGVTVTPFPVDYKSNQIYRGPEVFFPGPSNLLYSSYAIKEYIGIVAYWLKGYI